MKREVIHPEEPKTGKRYWRSLSEFAQTPEFQEKLDREFLDGQSEMKDEAEAETSRRTFLKLMGASTAMGLAACRRPELFIKPYAKSPEWMIPGKALYYATAMPRLGGCTPLVVTTFEGRPTHLAGNPLHPESNGGLDVYAQASVLNLYDRDRATQFLKGGKESTKADFKAALAEKKTAWAKDGGKGVAILLDHNNSPTRARLLGEVKKKFSAVKTYRYEALAPVNVHAATKLAYGDGVAVVHHLDKAERVLSLDCDFMGLDRIGNNTTSDFMKGRKAEKPGDPLNRLYVAEARYSVTGGMADHRLRVAPSQIFRLAAELASLLGAAPALAGNELPNAKVSKPWVEEVAKDLLASKGKAVVVAGQGQPVEVHLLVAAMNQALGAVGSVIELKQGEKDEAGTLSDLAKALESKEITTVIGITEADPVYDAPADLKFAEKLGGAELILLATRHRTATARAAAWVVPGTHYLEQWGDARSTDGTYSIVQPMILPLHSGVSDIDLLNSLIVDKEEEPAPAIPGMPEEPGPAHKAVRATFDAICQAANKEEAWNFALRDGFVPNTAYPAATTAANPAAVQAVANYKPLAAPTAETVEVSFVPCSKVYDGRYINNAWLQEAPDPVSKVTWDNCALVSFRTAMEVLKLERKFLSVDQEAAVIQLDVNGAKQYFPVIVIPGHADHVITVTLGYGQGTGENGPGLVGQGTGYNAYGLRTTAQPYFASAKLRRTVDTYRLALTQEHSAMYGRALVREGTQDDWKENADFVLEMGSDAHVHGTREEKKKQQEFSLYKPVGAKKTKDDEGYEGSIGAGESEAEKERVAHLNDSLHQWSMVIDLNRCIGCSSCLVACQSENNIPIVGKDQVIRGREMHWIRMDRYFATDLDDHVLPETKSPVSWLVGEDKDVWDEDFMDEPEMVVQPVGCQHCESAPCETVCPVNATVHSPDGLNLMVYNRCIGTRYCANNCPFKARRFNFFDYNKRNPLAKNSIAGIEHNNLYSGPLGERWDTELSKLQKNPNVTVRMRGVMEKCTYCLQRIEGARSETRARVRRNAALASGKFDESLEIKKTDLRIKKDGVKVACQEACPADAIMFGNIAEGSADTVNAWRKNSRNYELLSYLSIKARTSYLGRIKNPNQALVARIDYEKKKAGNASKLHPVSTHGAGHAGGSETPAAHH
ncbi:MAG: TAT-variant-translocated molybdopterin oxidoreductase [Verrucomicrobiales bacterium]|nr:TAT-variant-translocated molybdopterin oxidoreductase [Verrucomicrobiales bacterium]